MKIKYLQNWFTHTRRNGWCTLARSEGIDNLDIGFTRYSDFIIPFSDANRKSISEVPHQNIYRFDNETRVFEKSVYLGLTHESSPRPGLWFCHALVQSGLEDFWPAAVFINEDHFKKDFPPEEDTILFTQTIPEKYIEFANWGEYFNDQSSIIKNIYKSSLIAIVNRIVLKGDDGNYTIFIKSDDIEDTGNIILLLNLIFPKKLACQLTFINYYLFPEKVISGPFRIVGLIPQSENPEKWEGDKTSFGYFDLLDKSLDVNPDIYSQQIFRWIHTNETERIISFFEWMEKNSLDTSFRILPQCTSLYRIINNHIKITLASYNEITSVFEDNVFLVKRLLWSELCQTDVPFLETILLSEITNPDTFNEDIVKEVLDFAREQNFQSDFYLNSLNKMLRKYSNGMQDDTIGMLPFFPENLTVELREQIIMHFQEKNPELFIKLYISDVAERRSPEYLSKVVDRLKDNGSLVKRILTESTLLNGLPDPFWIKVFKELSTKSFTEDSLKILRPRVLQELFSLSGNELDGIIDENITELLKRFHEPETRAIINALYHKLDEKIQNTLSEFSLQSSYEDYLSNYIKISKYGCEICLILLCNGVNSKLIKNRTTEFLNNLRDEEFKSICENYLFVASEFDPIAQILTELLLEKKDPAFLLIFNNHNLHLIPGERMKLLLGKAENDLISGSVCCDLPKPEQLLIAFDKNHINPLHYPFILHELLRNNPISEFKMLVTLDLDRSMKDAIQNTAILLKASENTGTLAKTLSNYCSILKLKTTCDAEINSRVANLFLDFCLDPARNSWLNRQDEKMSEVYQIISGYLESEFPGYFLYSIVRSFRYKHWVGRMKKGVLGTHLHEANKIALLLKQFDRLHTKRHKSKCLIKVMRDFDLTGVLTIREAIEFRDQKSFSKENLEKLAIHKSIKQSFPHSFNGITDELKSVLKNITDSK